MQQEQAQSSFMLMETNLLIWNCFAILRLEIDLWLWRTQENKKLVWTEMPIPNYNPSMYFDKFQSMIKPWWSVAINRAYSRACSLRGNTVVAQQGLFILFTLAVENEHHPEMLENLITESTFLAKKDDVDRDHLWTEIL